MAGDTDDDRRQAAVAHRVGEGLDTLSIHEFDQRIALLRGEIDRLEAAKRLKLAAMEQAGSVFKR
jgi:uncharacterized small protein (DUF1192 family)